MKNLIKDIELKKLSRHYIYLKYYALLLCLLPVVLLSCNKQLDIQSTHASSQGSGWSSYDDVGSALNGMYSLLRTAMASDNSYWFFGELRNGDFTSYSNSDLQAVINGQLNVSSDYIQDALNWRRFYAVIDACNEFIQYSSQALADSRYSQINNKMDIAQARAIRAYVYFYICRIWGDVPLITSVNTGDFTTTPRTDKATVMAFAKSEMLAAAQVLPFKYGNANDNIFPGTYYGYDYTRYYNTLINRVFAYATLAHMAAWEGKYNDVKTYTNYVMSNYSQIGATYITAITDLTAANTFFGALSNVNQFFSIDMQAAYNESGLSGIGHIEYWTLAEPLVAKQLPVIYVSKDTINKMFDSYKDARFQYDSTSSSYSTDYFTNYSGNLPIFSKIKVVGDGSTTTNLNVFSSFIVLDRLEDITLLRAEALAVLNDSTSATTLLNIVRQNRNLDAYQGNGGSALIQAIFAERRRELIGEGYRWYDLVRLHKLLRDDPAFNSLIDNGGIYWPVSHTVMANNPLITQNSYWLTDSK